MQLMCLIIKIFFFHKLDIFSDRWLWSIRGCKSARIKLITNADCSDFIEVMSISVSSDLKENYEISLENISSIPRCLAGMSTKRW